MEQAWSKREKGATSTESTGPKVKTAAAAVEQKRKKGAQSRRPRQRQSRRPRPRQSRRPRPRQSRPPRPRRSRLRPPLHSRKANVSRHPGVRVRSSTKVDERTRFTRGHRHLRGRGPHPRLLLASAHCPSGRRQCRCPGKPVCECALPRALLVSCRPAPRGLQGEGAAVM